MAAEFVLKLLKKRLFSSPAAFRITLEKHAATVGGGKAATVANRDIDNFDDDYADDEQYEAETEEVVGSASQALSALSADERALLRRLREFAAKSALRPNCKAQTLIDWLKKTTPIIAGMTCGSSSSRSTAPRRSGCSICWRGRGWRRKAVWK
jgi:hypothetical protein